MGQLTNQFVSQSYQGLLNLANANTGFTANLQTITDGLGGSSPLQISQTQVNISGTFTVNGAPVSVDTGSLVTTSSFNAFTSSVDLRFDGIELETGSLQNQINQKLDTGSFNAYTSSNDSKVNSLIAGTGSYATTSSLTAVSQSIASTDLAQNNRLTAIESITGSLATTGSLNSYTLTSSFNAYTSSNDSKVNSLIAATASYVTEAESGSFMKTGSVAGNTLTFTKGDGSTFDLTVATGSQNRNGLITTGSAGTTQYITSSLNIGLAGSGVGSLDVQDAIVAGYEIDTPRLFVNSIRPNTGSDINVTGSLIIDGNISATSASFTYVNTVYETASVIYSSGSNQLGDASNDTQTLHGTVILPDGQLNIDGTPTASIVLGQGSGAVGLENDGNGFVVSTDQQRLRVNLSGVQVTGSLRQSGTFYPDVIDWYSSSIVQNTGSYVLTTDALGVTQYDSYQNVASALQPFISGSTVASSSFATNAATASIAYDVVVYGKCDNPGGLTRGTIVRIVGANGDNPLFNSASWTDDLNSANTLGMLSEDAAYNSFANVVVQGKVIGINTNGMTAGDLLFLSSSGQYTTSSVPAPYHEVRLGQVLRANLNNGSAYVTVDNGYELTELHDVDITSPINGDLLVYRSGSYGQWVNETGGELGFATTGSNRFNGNQIITGSVNVTGSVFVTGSVNLTPGAGSSTETGLQLGGNSSNKLWVSGSNNDVYLRSINDIILRGGSNANLKITGTGDATPISASIFGNASISGSLDVRNGNLDLFSNNTTVNTDLYLTSSQAGQSNIIQGWNDSPSPSGAGATQANYTGSLRITGSNNIVQMPQIRATGVGGGTDQQGYISGSGNMILSNFSGMYLNTGSLLFPKTVTNIIGNGSSITMNFTTSSLAGGHPQVGNNLVLGGNININSNSGSLSVTTNAIMGGNITSNQNFVTNVRPTIGQNNIIGAVTLNHLSSSINFANNYVNTTGLNINNAVSSSITNNSLGVTNNLFFGGSGGATLNIFASGSQNSNSTRLISDSIIGGRSIIISSSFVSSSNANLVSALVVGNNLTVSGSHITNTNGGSAFLGRFNDATSLHLAQDIVFAVGTGTGTANRRTGLYVTSGSLVGVSGSLDVKGVTNALVVTGSQTIQHSVAGQSALTVIAQSIGQPAVSITGSLNVSGSGDHTIVGNTLRVTGQTQLSGNSDFPLYVSGTIQTQRLQFDGNPFNTNPASNLGAIRMAGDNQTFQYTNYNKAEITSQSFIDQYVNTGSLTTQTKFGATYGGTTARIDVINNNGARIVDVTTDNMTITGSVKLSSVMNLQPQNPLPAGNIGDLAVSSSNQLYFYNGAWTLVV